MSMEQIVNFSVQWGPTILFGIIVFFGFLTGIRRGFRKSLILAVNALIAFVFIVGTYIYLVNNPKVDELVVTYSNKILSIFGQQDLQTMLGASSDAKSFKDILTDIIPRNMDLGDGIVAVMKENGAYLGALINSIYRLVFAIVSGIVYLILIFILYIVYLIFFSERKYKKKKDKYYVIGTGKEYKKRRLLGGLVGSLRSVVAGLVFLSFFGSFLFVVTGSDGTKESVDVNFGNGEIDKYYDIYESVSEYGNHGIYGLLNSVKDKENTPYYLYIADLVLSGSYEDLENNVSAEIVYREEISNYIRFTKSSIELLSKYCLEDLDNKVEGDIAAGLSEIFANEGFKEDFNKIIDEFEEDTFFISFGLSAIDSIARNINDFKFTENLDQQTRDILSIILTGEDAITVSNIINKEDIKIILNTVIGVLAESDNFDEGNKSILRTLSIVEGVLQEVSKLSMFTDQSKKDKGNKVLANLYDYVIESISKEDENEEIKDLMTTDKIIKLTNKSSSKIDWMDELSSLLDVVVDLLIIFDNNYNEENPTSGLLHMLDADNPNKEENKSALDNVIDKLSKSEILGLALSTTFVNDMLVELVSSLAENAILPHKIDYVRKINADGTVEAEGEIYVLLKSLELLLENGFADFYDKMQSEDGFNSQSEQFTELSNILLKEITVDGKNTSVIDTLLNSKILKYTLSQVLTNIEVGEFSIVIPKSCQETVPEEVIIINNETLKSLVSNISLLLPKEGEELLSIKTINENKQTILENDILHASIILFFVNTFNNEGEATIVIPQQYNVNKEELEATFETNIWVTTSEINLIMNAMDAIFDLDTLDVNNISTESIAITSSSVAEVVKSSVLHATISKIVLDTLVNDNRSIPKDAMTGDVIAKTEIVDLVESIETLLGESLSSNTSFNMDNCVISYGANGTKGNLETILGSLIIKLIISDTIIQTLAKVPTSILTTVDLYNKPTEKGSIISNFELGKIIEIIGSNEETSDKEIYQINVAADMNFNGFDRSKMGFLKESTIARYKVSETLLMEEDLVIPVQCVTDMSLLGDETNVKVFNEIEFSRFLDGLNCVIPADSGFDNISIVMPQNSSDYNTVAASDVLRATITNKLEINGEAIYLDGDLDVTTFTNGINNIPVLNEDQFKKALAVINQLNGENSNSFIADVDLISLANNFDDTELDIILSFNMMRYQVSNLMVIAGITSQNSDAVFTYTIKENTFIKSDEMVSVFKKDFIINYLSSIRTNI